MKTIVEITINRNIEITNSHIFNTLCKLHVYSLLEHHYTEDKFESAVLLVALFEHQLLRYIVTCFNHLMKRKSVFFNVKSFIVSSRDKC
jgi:hypothetical protein